MVFPKYGSRLLRDIPTLAIDKEFNFDPLHQIKRSNTLFIAESIFALDWQMAQSKQVSVTASVPLIVLSFT